MRVGVTKVRIGGRLIGFASTPDLPLENNYTTLCFLFTFHPLAHWNSGLCAGEMVGTVTGRPFILYARVRRRRLPWLVVFAGVSLPMFAAARRLCHPTGVVKSSQGSH